MIKVVTAIDSFKGSVSSLEAGYAAKDAVLSVYKDAEAVVMPLADGGEGTVETLVSGMNGKLVNAEVTGPTGDKITAEYGIIGNTAVIEMAAAAGLPITPVEKRNPLYTTTYGVGELILNAVKNGCDEFIVGIGGSATNDAGVGMLQALGFEFYDKDGNPVKTGGKYVADIAAINTDNVNPKIKNCKFRIACDVDNPLCGKRGASYIYGPQKGATPEIVEFLDNALKSFSEVTKNKLGIDCADDEGSGAAGGLGYAFRAYLNGELKPGIEIVLDEIGIDKVLADADFVITGEGRIDSQSAMGKAPVGVAKRAKRYGAKVIGIAGCVADDAYLCNAAGIDAIFAVTDKAMSLEEAMDKETTKKNIRKTVTQIFNLIKTFE